MDIIIRADRKIKNEPIAEHIFSGKRVIDRFIKLALDLKAGIFIVSDKKLEDGSNAKVIPASEINNINNIKNSVILDLNYIYDERKLKNLIKKGKSPEKAIIKQNKEIADLNSFGCLFERKEWNPISKYYIEPLGEKIAFLIRNSAITPNNVTFLNIILGILSSYLIYLNTSLSLIIFGVWVRAFHMLDIVDGHMARLKNKGSAFGKWIDGGGDKLVISIWYIAIASALYFKSGNTFFLFVGLIALLGMYIYNYLLLTSVAYFRNFESGYKVKEGAVNNPLASFVLLFINYDIHLHILTILAIIDKLEWFILFYAAYYNFMWIMYFLFYFYRYIKNQDVKEI